MASAVWEAFQRAERRNLDAEAVGKVDTVYRYMTGSRQYTAKLPLVEGLLVKDSPSFQPGEWYATSKHSGGRFNVGFIELLQRVENQADDGFTWPSWPMVAKP